LILQGDQKLSVNLMITVPTQLMIWRWPSQNTFGMWTMLYWTRSSRTQFGVSINVWRLAVDTINITCNFLYCNHLVYWNFLITLYNCRNHSLNCIQQISELKLIVYFTCSDITVGFLQTPYKWVVIGQGGTVSYFPISPSASNLPHSSAWHILCILYVTWEG